MDEAMRSELDELIGAAEIPLRRDGDLDASDFLAAYGKRLGISTVRHAHNVMQRMAEKSEALEYILVRDAARSRSLRVLRRVTGKGP